MVLVYVTWLFYFPQVSVFNRYIGVGVGYVSNTRNQFTEFRHLNPLNFVIFEEKARII